MRIGLKEKDNMKTTCMVMVSKENVINRDQRMPMRDYLSTEEDHVGFKPC